MLVMFPLGRLMTKALVEVVMLKLLPSVPVETLAIMLLTIRLELEERFLLASVVTRELAVKVAILRLPEGVTDRMIEPEEEATTKMVLAVLVGATTLKAAAAVVVLIPMLPLAKTVKIVALDEEATVKIGRDWAVALPWTVKEAVGVVELIASCWAVLSHRKLALPAVVLAPVK